MTSLRVAAPASPARTGVWIGIATITMSFTAYTSALVVRQGSGGDWQHFQLPPILYFNTLVLVASSATLEAGRRPKAAVAGWLWLTLGLGLLFIAGQVLAWRDLAAQGLYLATNPSSAFFYVFTALHALHLLGGVAALGYVLSRQRRAAGEVPVQALGAAALYWHFMTVLWLYLLLVLALRL
ncbi:MAG: heme-copper oxidase subunit III [Gemmatimonadales bacterium]